MPHHPLLEVFKGKLKKKMHASCKAAIALILTELSECCCEESMNGRAFWSMSRIEYFK